MSETPLTVAIRQALESRARVSQQEALVAQLINSRHETMLSQARALLTSMRSTQALLDRRAAEFEAQLR
jgi:hypothetical protein